MDKIINMTAAQLHDAFMKGELTAHAIVSAFLAQIEKHNGTTNAFLSVFTERALEQAKEQDARKAAGKPLGKLAGVPFAIKDNIHLDKQITTCASKFLENYHAHFSATAVRLLEEADAIPIGKTNCDEFAMGSTNENSAFGSVKNPWNLKCVPGGSSGGSAAAVAARMCPVALGSDTGGSIRQPAAFCGIVGYKPTYGRISRFGLVAFGSSLDQIGPFARSVEDVSLFMEVMGAPCNRDSTSLPDPAEEYLPALNQEIKGKKVGVPRAFLNALNSEAAANFEASLERLKQLGAQIVDIDLDLLNHSIPVYYILASAEASTNLSRFDGIRYGRRSEQAKTLDEVYDLSRKEGFGPEVKRRIMLGTYVLSSGYQDAFYRKAQKVRTLVIRQFEAAFAECDVIAMPTTPTPAFEIGAAKEPIEIYLQDIYTIGANLAGLPAVSVPSGFSASGLPFGFQILGPQKQDVRVCNFAQQFEQASTTPDTAPEMV